MVKVYEFPAICTTSTEKGRAFNKPQNIVLQMPSGAPSVVHSTAGAKTLDDDTKLIKISGIGTITWPNGVTEDFDGVEFRGVAFGSSLTINA